MPSITLNPTSGNPGITITVNGTGFSNSTRIKMLVDKPNGAVKTYKTSPTGTFTGKVVTGTASSLGVHTVDITTTTSSTVLAHATFTLVSTTPPPPPPPPTITITSGPTTTTTENGATITWSLSEPCTGQVKYGTTTAYGQLSTPETSFTFSTHVQQLTGLTAGTTYHYQVFGANAAGATYISSDKTFTTQAVVPPPPPPPIGTYPTPRTLTAIPFNNDTKPAVNQVITDSTYGTKIRRISGDGHQNQYAKHQAWSKDGSLIYLQFGWMVDGNTYANLGQISSGSEFPVWSNLESATMYSAAGTGGSGKPQINRWTRSTGWQLWDDLSRLGYTNVDLGSYEGTVSRTDRVSLIATKSDNSVWLLVYEIPTKTVIGAVARNYPGASAISQSGSYFVASFNSSGSGINNGQWLFRDNGTPIRQMQMATDPGVVYGHQDFGYAINGTEVLVFMHPGGIGTFAEELETGVQYMIAKGYPESIYGLGHVSCTNYGRPGYAYLSSNSFYAINGINTPGVNAGVAARIEPWTSTTKYEVYAMLHAENPVTHQVYDYAPHVAANRDGTKIIWGSVWSNTTSGPMSAYIAGLDAPVLAPTIYGPGIGFDSKNNYQPGWTNNQKVSHRFKASTTSQLTSIAFNQRGGPGGYSGGTGGSVRVEVQTDNAGTPSGTVLSSLTFVTPNPATAWERHDYNTFPNPATLTRGTIYHIVFVNADANWATNYISVNEIFKYDSTSPVQPAFKDTDYAVLTNNGSGWNQSSNDSPVMDLVYADGTHDGNAYFAVITGYEVALTGATKVREHFTYSGPTKAFSNVYLRVQRTGGSGTLTATIAGVSGSADISSLPQVLFSDLSGGRWVKIPLVFTLTQGQVYDLEFSTNSALKVMPIRAVDDIVWESRNFTDGEAQKNTGSGWVQMYNNFTDLQFYIE